MYRNLLLGLALCSASSYAAPSITSVSGTIGDDQVVTIAGSGFGANALRAEWLGGTSGTIESSTAGTAFLATPRSGWSEDSALDESRVDTRRAYSGSKSLVFDPMLARYNDGRFGLVFDAGTSFPELYSSYVAYFDAGGATAGQWKMIRWCFRASVTDDSVPNAYMANWEGAPGDFFYIQAGDATKQNWFDSQVLPLTSAWYRVETYFRPSSQTTASDGEFWVKTTRITDGLVQTQRFSGLKTYSDAEVNRYRYIVFQNYMGNGNYDVQTKVWIDDIYVAQTQSRVELCRSSTWSGCTTKELQPSTSWSSNSISIRLNRGGQSSLAGLYVYVVDSSGVANTNGFPLIASATPRAPSSVSAN